MYMLLFNFFFGSNFIFISLKIMYLIHYHIPKTLQELNLPIYISHTSILTKGYFLNTHTHHTLSLKVNQYMINYRASISIYN